MPAATLPREAQARVEESWVYFTPSRRRRAMFSPSRDAGSLKAEHLARLATFARLVLPIGALSSTATGSGPPGSDAYKIFHQLPPRPQQARPPAADLRARSSCDPGHEIKV